MEYDPQLEAAADDFVTPFYSDMLHGNILRRPAAEQSEFVRELLAASELLEEETAARLLDFPEWRGRMAISWMVGLQGWDAFVPQMGKLMLRSELVYAGQGFAVGLALVGSAEAANQLHAYLDRWLLEVDCFYDQHWAMLALREIDRRQGSSHADRHREQWDTWSSHDGRVSAVAPLPQVVELLSLPSSEQPDADGAKVRVDAHLAVEHQRVDELKQLLDAGWDVDDPTDDGMTLLHHAIDIEVDAAAQTGEPLAADLTKLLVARGADLRHRWHGQTPSEAAAARGHHLAVRVIEAGGDGGHPDDDHRVPAEPWRAFWRQTDKRE